MLKTLFLSLICGLSFSQTTTIHEKYQLNEGCPENSYCSKELGKKTAEFKATFKSNSISKQSKFIKEVGIPFKYWSTNKLDSNAVTFSSRCTYHRKSLDNYGRVIKDRQELYESTRFIKKTDSIAQINSAVPNFMVKEGTNNRIVIPRGGIPLFSKRDAYFFIQSYADIDLKLIIDNGKLKTTRQEYPDTNIKNTNCSDELIKTFKSLMFGEVFQNVYCKEIYDVQTKKYNKYIFGWSC